MCVCVFLPQATNLREGATLATGTDAVVGPWSMHVMEPAGSRKKPGRLDFLALPIDGNYDYILNAKELMMGIMWEQLKRYHWDFTLANHANHASYARRLRHVISLPKHSIFWNLILALSLH